MKFKSFSLAVLTASMLAPGIMAAEGVEVDYLGVNNTLVRVTGDDKYLLFPVQESSDDARINVLVDGNIAETIFVRLAKSKTDYSVPFDLAPYGNARIENFKIYSITE